MDSLEILNIEFSTLFFKDAVEVLPSSKNFPEAPMLDSSPVLKKGWTEKEGQEETKKEVENSIPDEFENKERFELKTGGLIDFAGINESGPEETPINEVRTVKIYKSEKS